MKITFLGKEYHHAYFNGDYFTNNNSSISFVISNRLEIDFLNSTIIRLTIPNHFSPDYISSLQDLCETVQKILDDNQEIILRAISNALNDMPKQIELANNEFSKVLIFL